MFGLSAATRSGGLLSFFLTVLSILAVAPYAFPAQDEGELRIVVIDAGHGGKDPGTSGKHSREKDIVLSVALKLGDYIRAEFPSVKVVYTREEDVFVELNRRTEIANENKADLFISIHCNSAPSSVAVGAETFVMGLNATQSNLEVAMRENAVITYEDDYTTKYEGYDPNSPESFMIFSLMQNVFLNQSLEFAGVIQDEFARRVKRVNRGVKQERFLVLHRTSMPAVLVELGFLSNPREEQFLLSEEGQALMASAIFRAFKTYKRNRDLRALPSMVVSADEKVSPAPGESSSESSAQPVGSSSGRTFRIQVATVSRPIDKKHALRREFKDLIESKEGKVYRYYVAEYGSHAEATVRLAEVRKRYNDAFIVTFEDGRRVQ